MSFTPIMERPRFRRHAERLTPAVPTLLVSAILAVDFAGIEYSLYLLMPLCYLGYLAVCFALYLVSWFMAGRRHSRPAISCLLLFVAGLSMLGAVFPAESLIREHTRWNRVSANVKLLFKADDEYQFTIVGSGEGSREEFTLERGFTNISINREYGRGPSLNYRLRPELVFTEQIDCDEKRRTQVENLRDLYARKGLEAVARDEWIAEYLSVLGAYRTVTSVDAFEERFAGMERSSIALMPFENAVYRLSFLIISLLALVLSWLLTGCLDRRQQDAGCS